ncbi:2166_t:CDS:2, partial [Racocetra fulgida]
KIQSETEDELYDVNSELIDTIQDLNELDDNSDLANDILKLNQTLLTEDRNIKERIALLRQPPLPKRPADDNIDENYFLTRIINNAKQQRNVGENTNAQISWI